MTSYVIRLYFSVVFSCSFAGIPMLYVLVPVAVDVGCFDGAVVDCSFACYLSDTAFYFIFLLPMVVIMIFNSVVFGMVLRVINRIYSTGKHRLNSQPPTVLPNKER